MFTFIDFLLSQEMAARVQQAQILQKKVEDVEKKDTEVIKFLYSNFPGQIGCVPSTLLGQLSHCLIAGYTVPVDVYNHSFLSSFSFVKKK